MSIGPPERLPLPGGSFIVESGDGRVIATSDRSVGSQFPYAGCWILHADRPTQPIRVDSGADIGDVAISPDGRWVVTTTFQVGAAKLWDARDGRLVKQLADWGSAYPRFSPDGRWLATSLDAARVFTVETWEAGPWLGTGTGAFFTPDSQLVVLPAANGLRLFDLARQRDIATLEDPNLDSIWQALDTPDGTKLITVNMVKGMHVWDLRLIRQQLRERGLDWESPPLADAAPTRQLAEPVKVEIQLGHDAKAPSPNKRAAKPPAATGS